MNWPADRREDYYRVQAVDPKGRVKTLLDRMSYAQAAGNFHLWARDMKKSRRADPNYEYVALRLTRAYDIIETSTYRDRESTRTPRDTEVLNYVKL